MENPKSDEKNEPTAPPAENKDGGPTPSPTVTVLMQAPPSQTPVQQAGALNGYSRSCNADNPCCCSHVQTSAKIFGGVYGILLAVGGLLSLWIVFFPEEFLAQVACANAKSKGKCIASAKVKVNRSIVLIVMIVAVLRSLFYTIIGICTSLVLCMPTPGANCAGISAQGTLVVLSGLSIILDCITGQYVMLVNEILSIIMPLYLIWVLVCYRNFLKAGNQSPKALAFAPNNAQPRQNPPQHSQYPPPPQYPQYPPPPQYPQYPPSPQHPSQGMPYPPPPTQPYQPR